MSGFFKFVLYLGVAMGLAGFFLPSFYDQPWVASLPTQTKNILSFGGLAAIAIGLIGRTVTRKEDDEVVWK